VKLLRQSGVNAKRTVALLAAASALGAPLGAAGADAPAAEGLPQDCPAIQPGPEDAIARTRRPLTRVERELMSRALQGDPDAAYTVALRYFEGTCVQRSFAEAYRWFAAAAAGHACALAAASHLRAEGLGVERDPAAAREGLRAAQAAGCARAYYLQAALEEKSARPERRQLARELLERGAGLDDGHALNLAGVYREVDGDRQGAEALYRRAVAAGNRAARVNLQRLDRYFSRHERKESLESLRARVTAREPSAQFALAQRYHRGDGLAVDYVAAIRFYRLAAEAKYPPAVEMLNLILSRADPRQPGGIDPAWMQRLAYHELATDERGKSRGVLQPVVDEDPFYGMAPRVDVPAAASR
jgi:TPR repeat protein